MATNDTTQAILFYLNYHGFKAWRTNTVGIYDQKRGVYRKNASLLKGVPDIIGFRRSDARFIGVEIKTGRDDLSGHQGAFLDELVQAGGFALVVGSFDEFAEKFEVVRHPS